MFKEYESRHQQSSPGLFRVGSYLEDTEPGSGEVSQYLRCCVCFINATLQWERQGHLIFLQIQRGRRNARNWGRMTTGWTWDAQIRSNASPNSSRVTDRGGKAAEWKNSKTKEALPCLHMTKRGLSDFVGDWTSIQGLETHAQFDNGCTQLNSQLTETRLCCQRHERRQWWWWWWWGFFLCYC